MLGFTKLTFNCKKLHSSLCVFIFALALSPVGGIAGHHAKYEKHALEYPQQEWRIKLPSELGITEGEINRLFDLSFADSATQAVVLIKDGYLIGERYAEGYQQNSPGTSWSMAKSFYASLIGISLDRGEIASLDDPVALYLDYFNDERAAITIRDLLNMSSGLEMPDHEHEKMFFSSDHLAYARAVGVEKPANKKFEYNNVNSMLLADILEKATGKKADVLLRERVFDKIGLTDVTLWRDAAGNPLTYCCVDASARQYSRFGLLFARNGRWNDEQVISKDFVNQTFSRVWDQLESTTINQQRGYSLHWWNSRYDDRAVIFNTSGKFGQYIFVDRDNDLVFTRITRYHPTGGSVQRWGPLSYINWLGSVDFRRRLAEFLDSVGIIKIRGNVTTPVTFDDGVSSEFFSNYSEIMDALVEVSEK
ncbi:MAG: serine hydrolase domain-containing protein [Porticoccaceae bacterium]